VSKRRPRNRSAGFKPLDNWLSRHRNPVSFWMHMVGVPMTVAAVVVAVMGYVLAGVGLFVAGYALQFLGHAIEGNRSGEEMLVRKLLRRREDRHD
jgi:hypothetical protein